MDSPTTLFRVRIDLSGVHRMTQLTKISITAISQALGSPRHILPRAQSGIGTTITGTNCQPGLVTIRFHSQHANGLIVLIPTVTGIFFTQIVDNTRQTTRTTNCQLLLYSARNHRRVRHRFTTLICTRRTSNIVRLHTCSPFRTSTPSTRLPPVIGTYRIVRNNHRPAVDLSGHTTTGTVARRLVDLNRQHVNLVGNPGDDPLAHRHITNCRSTLHSTNLTYSPRLVYRNSFDLRTNSSNTTTVLQLPRHPATLFYRGSRVTVNTLGRVGRRNLHIPRSISLINFSSVPFTTCYSPPLAAVARPTRIFNRGTIRVLVTLVRGRAVTRQRIILPFRIALHTDATLTQIGWSEYEGFRSPRGPEIACGRDGGAAGR